MPIISRKTQKIFAQNATNNGQFGSAQLGTKVLSSDLATLQNLTAFTSGWNSATMSAKKLPTLEEMQALHYITTSQIAYLFQEGIAEYDSGTEYRINSLVKKSGTTQIYKSLTDANTGNALTDGTKWTLCGDLSNLYKITPATTTTQGISYLLPNRNILINGAMAIDQRNAGASQTITAGSALAYTIDRWYAYCTGANATGQRVAGTAPNQFNYRFTGASSITKIGFAQRIEASNSQHLAGKTATLSVDLANSLLTTITWTAWYANTTDTFGTLASPTRTQIATGTFTVNSTLTRYATSIAIPAGATTGIEIELSVGSQTSGTWTIGRAQLEDTPEQTTFEYRSIQQELNLCERYFKKTFALETAPANNAGLVNALAVRCPSSTNNNFSIHWDLNMRANPTITTYNPSSGTSGFWFTDDTSTSISSSIETNLGAKRANISHTGAVGVSQLDYYIHATASAEL